MKLEEKITAGGNFFVDKEMCSQIDYEVTYCDLLFTKYCPVKCSYAKKKVLAVRIKEE